MQGDHCLISPASWHLGMRRVCTWRPGGSRCEEEGMMRLVAKQGQTDWEEAISGNPEVRRQEASYLSR